ncbi:hypothetical protein WDH52_17170 [Streptomyces sp. TRM70308]|uniref:hypothetical protein n=1 Tax=Streptomyces sp. TRM70308 TaxID=3131932 RepID=UPI003CFF7EF3
MGNSGVTEVRRERTRGERLTEGLTVALALSLVGPAVAFGMTAWQLVTATGTTVFSRFLAPVVFLALVALPLVLARLVFRAGRRKGRERLTAAVPAALTLFGGSAVPFVALCLIFVYAD